MCLLSEQESGPVGITAAAQKSTRPHTHAERRRLRSPFSISINFHNKNNRNLLTNYCRKSLEASELKAFIAGAANLHISLDIALALLLEVSVCTFNTRITCECSHNEWTVHNNYGACGMVILDLVSLEGAILLHDVPHWPGWVAIVICPAH